MDPAEKQILADKLRQAGLWEEAYRFRESVRQQLRSSGIPRKEAVDEAWSKTADKYLPLIEQIKDCTPFQVVLPDGASSFDELVDHDYQESDHAAQMQDAYRWIMQEFHRIVIDEADTTTVDYRRTNTPPPTILACGILETWAAKPRDKRDGLYREIRASLHNAPPRPETDEPSKSAGDEYLDSLDLKPPRKQEQGPCPNAT